MRSEFRVFAFDAGREYYKKGNLDSIRLTAVLKAFKQKHDGIVPPSVKHGFTVDTWKEAVRANDIKLFATAKHVPPVKKVHTIQEKLKERPELRPLIDWCMECIKTDRAQQAGLQYSPNLEKMKHEWTRQKDNGVPFFVKHKSVK